MSNNEMNNNFTNTEPSLSFSTGLPPTYMSSGGGSEPGPTPVFPDSSYISPKLTSKSPKSPPPLKRRFSIPDTSYISPKLASESFKDPPPLKRCRAIAPNFDDEDEEDYKEKKPKKVKKEEDDDGDTLEYVDSDEKEKKFISKSVPKIKIPSDFNPDIPKNVINFLRNLNKREFNFIMSRGYIVKAGDLHDKKIKKVVLELRNYHGIVVEKKK